MRCDHPDWVFNRLMVSGSEERLRAFRFSARGCGAVPWVIDYHHVEEDLFALLLRQPPQRRSIGIEAARAIAREWRSFLQEGTERVHACAGVSTACPFDLHSLIPVPWTILVKGPDAPDARAWLWENWGTTWTLRHVMECMVTPAELQALRSRHVLAPQDLALRYSFWSADWSPWPALLHLRKAWPSLRFSLSFQVADEAAPSPDTVQPHEDNPGAMGGLY